MILVNKGQRGKVMKMKKEIRNHYLLYSALFFMMCAAAFAPFWEEGKSFIWGAGVEDGLSQHFSALAYYGEWLRKFFSNLWAGHLKLPMWEMSLGYGADILSTLNYYAIGDPLNLLYGFVSKQNTETMYNVLILVRMYLAGIAFLMYAGKMKKRNYASVMGALVYVFCGFSFRLGLRHPFFLNPMIYFPLLCLGIEKIYKKEKPRVFILSVCLAAMSNYYFLYMLTIFAVIYAWIRFYHYISAKRVQAFFLTIARFAGYYILGIAMSAVVLLPSVIGFLGNGRNGVGVDWKTLIIYPGKYYLMLIENIVGYGNVGSNTNVGYLPIAGIAILFVLFSRRMKHKKYRAAFISSIIALALPIFGFAFNGFSYANNRWAFVLSFIVALLTAEMYPRFFMMSKRQKIGIGAGIVIYMIFCQAVNLTGEEFMKNNGILSAGIMTLVFYLVFLFFQKLGYDDRKLPTKLAFGILMIISVGIHGYYRFDQEQDGYTQEFLDRGTALEALQPENVTLLTSIKDSSFYRVHAEGYKYKNYGLVNNLNTIGGYYSITAGEVADAIKSYETLGMKYADKYKGLDQRSGLLSLAGVKYMTIPKDEENIPYGFVPVKKGRDTVLYKNSYVLPMAYSYDSYITESQYRRLNGVEREQAMLTEAVLEKSLAEINIRHQENEYHSRVSSISLSEKKISSPKGTGYSVINVPIDQRKETYLYFENLIYQDTQSRTGDLWLTGKKGTQGILVTQGGVEQKIYIQSTFSPYYFGRKDYMIRVNTNTSKKKAEIKLQFLSPGTYSFDQVSLITVDKKETFKKLKRLKRNSLKNINYDGNHFSGTFQGEKDQMVCVAIPYSKGWSAEIDGKPAKTYKANGMYIGVPVKKGTHKIKLSYVTPGVKTGAVFCGIGWIMFFLTGYGNSEYNVIKWLRKREEYYKNIKRRGK